MTKHFAVGSRVQGKISRNVGKKGRITEVMGSGRSKKFKVLWDIGPETNESTRGLAAAADENLAPPSATTDDFSSDDCTLLLESESVDSVPLEDEENSLEDELRNACSRGNIQEIRALLDLGVSFDAQRYMFLHRLCESDCVDIVRECLGRGANIEATDSIGQTSLMVAAGRQHCSCVELLLARGAAVDSCDCRGNTVLHYACRGRDLHEQILNLLLDHGADINARNYAGDTPFLVAISNGWLEWVEPLLSRGASANIADRIGTTPLQYATDENTARALLDAGADIDNRNRFGRTALERACRRHDKTLVELFLSRGAAFIDVNQLVNIAKESYQSKLKDGQEFVRFLEEYVSLMHHHPVMK